eukprot:3764366-Lingulodinium_polyedra.AAC.1
MARRAQPAAGPSLPHRARTERSPPMPRGLLHSSGGLGCPESRANAGMSVPKARGAANLSARTPTMLLHVPG